MVNQAFLYFFDFVPGHLLKTYLNVWARALYLLEHTFIQVEGTVYQQTSGLSQGSAAAPFLADFTLLMLDIQFRAAFPYIWHGRYLDDILLVIPEGEDPLVHMYALQSLYQANQQYITQQHAGRDGFAAWLGFEIHPCGDFRVYVKPTWVNLFSPLYDSISPRLHVGYLIIMAIRFIIFTSSEVYFLEIRNRFCEGLPGRGYPPVIQTLILDKITDAKSFDPRTYQGHFHLRTIFGYWLRQSKTWRKIHHKQSPYIEFWQGTLYSTELLHINQVLSRDLIGDRPGVRPSPTWTITTTPVPPREGTDMIPSVPTLNLPSPDQSSNPSSQSIHSGLGSAHSIDSDDSNINGPDWWSNRTRINVAMPINMSWHDAITTQFSGRIPGGAGADDINILYEWGPRYLEYLQICSSHLPSQQFYKRSPPINHGFRKSPLSKL